MRTTTTIEGLTLENLVDLFSTATYGSSWLEIDTTDQTEVEAEDGDCREDIWAKALLRGEYIACIDHNAEGEIYGNLGGVVSEDEDESVCYLITLQDVIDGLQKCVDGTFKGDKSEHDWLAKYFQHFKAGEGDMDNPEAEAIMQVIMFNELIYG